ncbi:MAG: GDP-mannose 4,6-dehydratase, partial [Anaerolineae bacterium]|nr:GDP-mannose 4,6-dehydratase [Anaerolineae bacterium]
LDETASANPVSWYGESKRDAEIAVRSFGDGFPVTIVRPSPVYGERERDISQTFPLIAAGIQPRLGLRTSYTVMVYVSDLVHGFILAAESAESVGETYFLNHPEVLTTAQVVQITAQAMGKTRGLPLPIPLTVIRLAAPLAEMSHHMLRVRPALTRDKAKELGYRYWVADSSKAGRELGWQARHDLLSGMKLTTQAYFDTQRMLRQMPLETQPLLWLKYVVVGIILGALIEITSAIAPFYTFDPGWLVLPVIVGGFGLALGSLAMALRERGSLVQLVAGTIITGLIELANALNLIPLVGWTFAPGWPFGIDNPLLRSLVLGLAGGLFLLVVNGVMRQLYQRRLQLG